MNLLRIEPTGYYGQLTEHAIFKFQQRKGLVASKDSPGAGVFGPNTRNAVNSILGLRANTKSMIASKTASFKENKPMIAETKVEESKEEVSSSSNMIAFSDDLFLGSNGAEVEILQNKLKALGFYKGGVTTDYFGNVTHDAVISFQLDQGIISSTKDPGAGNVGPRTRAALNAVL